MGIDIYVDRSSPSITNKPPKLLEEIEQERHTVHNQELQIQSYLQHTAFVTTSTTIYGLKDRVNI